MEFFPEAVKYATQACMWAEIAGYAVGAFAIGCVATVAVTVTNLLIRYNDRNNIRRHR